MHASGHEVWWRWYHRSYEELLHKLEKKEAEEHTNRRSRKESLVSAGVVLFGAGSYGAGLWVLCRWPLAQRAPAGLGMDGGSPPMMATSGYAVRAVLAAVWMWCSQCFGRKICTASVCADGSDAFGRRSLPWWHRREASAFLHPMEKSPRAKAQIPAALVCSTTASLGVVYLSGGIEFGVLSFCGPFDCVVVVVVLLFVFGRGWTGLVWL
ncbi:hypothetical protein BRADI_4g09946v3 [Brachypodium distachyon]|uniref:Uncharacterized protein n=1 Tax=Brachypodium distachyon TaxID=15368 RepID=A0A0Q3L3Q4_BRADI|nr:hypothetical protein BRADI_4g09946v3 [Brachypodium distachyon]